MNERPRYRVNAEHVWLNGTLYAKGAIVEYAGWPPPSLEPLNEPAKRIAAYFAQRRFDPFIPKTPWSAALGGFYLPALLQQWVPGPIHRARGEEGKALPSPVGDGEATSNMPAYESTQDTWIGGRFVNAGEMVVFLGWAPSDLLKPANQPAERAAAYFEQHKAHPGLLTSPYCYFADDLVLPELPKVEPDRRRGGYVVAEKPRAFTRKKSPASWDEFESGAA